MRRFLQITGGVFVFAWMLAVVAAGCAHLSTATPVPSDTPSGFPSASPFPTASPSPGACATQAPNTTLVIAMAASITATPVPTYGTIDGYTTVTSGGFFGNVATLINAHASDVVQFVNGETTGPATIFHSAAGFSGPTFPPVPYTFPSAVQQQVGTRISSQSWSTGRIAPSLTQFCFSQTLTLIVGKFYFGDLDYYNSSNMRDVIVVAP